MQHIKMARYSTEPRDHIFVKEYWLLHFAKNMSQNIVKNESKKISRKYVQKRMNHVK